MCDIKLYHSAIVIKLHGTGTARDRQINGIELKTQKWTHTPMVTWSLTRELKPSSGEKTAFSTNGAGTTGSYHVEECELIHLLLFSIFIRYFLHLHFKCYPGSPYTLSTALLLYPPTPNSRPWQCPVLGHRKLSIPRGLSFQWWLTKPSSATYAARDMSSGSTGYFILLFHL